MKCGRCGNQIMEQGHLYAYDGPICECGTDRIPLNHLGIPEQGYQESNRDYAIRCKLKEFDDKLDRILELLLLVRKDQ